MSEDLTDPWGEKSPWEVDQPAETEAQAEPAEEEKPVTTAPAPAPVVDTEAVTLSFKGGTGYDASLLVIRASSLEDMNRKLTEEAGALRAVLEKAAKIQAYNTSLNGGATASNQKPRFENGKVTYSNRQEPQRPPEVPDDWTYREGKTKTGKPYRAWFPPRGVDAQPHWL